MKKAILTICLISGLFLTALSQEKPADKSQPYQTDTKKPVTVSLSLPAGQLNDYFILMQSGNNLDNSTSISAARLTEIKKNAGDVAGYINSSIIKSFNTFIAEEKKIFVADSIKRVTPLKKP